MWKGPWLPENWEELPKWTLIKHELAKLKVPNGILDEEVGGAYSLMVEFDVPEGE